MHVATWCQAPAARPLARLLSPAGKAPGGGAKGKLGWAWRADGRQVAGALGARPLSFLRPVPHLLRAQPSSLIKPGTLVAQRSLCALCAGPLLGKMSCPHGAEEGRPALRAGWSPDGVGCGAGTRSAGWSVKTRAAKRGGLNRDSEQQLPLLGPAQEESRLSCLTPRLTPSVSQSLGGRPPPASLPARLQGP